MAIYIDRIMEKLDYYFSKNDYISAGKHLEYWYKEAKFENDNRALLFLTNELVGYNRKQGNKDLAIDYAEKAIDLCEKMQIENSVGAATSYLNAATAYKAFDMSDKAIPLFNKAREIYESKLENSDPRIAGLYNNMGLALSDLKRFDEAIELYNKAIKIMLVNENGAPDAAISYLNLANAKEAQKGIIEVEDEIDEFLSKAKELLDTKKDSESGYYAFVCEKCAPTFGYYGYFLYEKELKERAMNIYERN